MPTLLHMGTKVIYGHFPFKIIIKSFYCRCLSDSGVLALHSSILNKGHKGEVLSC